MRKPDLAGLGVTVALHALAVAALLSYAPARKALLAAAPLMVELITPAKLEVKPLQPPTELPRPRPVAMAAPLPLEPAPLLAVPAEAPATATAPPAPRTPVPLPVAAAEPAAITPPVFTADYLENPAPAYPALSRRLGEQGKVILRVLVNPAGAADEVLVRNSSGHARLDDAARDTVRRWKFVPARRGAEPVAAWVLIPISFRLEG
jgi:periplasmic protein TonB